MNPSTAVTTPYCSAQADADAEDSAFMMKLLDADDRLATAVAEVKRLNAVNAALQSSLKGQRAKTDELHRFARALQRKVNIAAQGVA